MLILSVTSRCFATFTCAPRDRRRVRYAQPDGLPTRPRHLVDRRSVARAAGSFYGTFFHFRRRAMRATRLLFFQCLVENHSSPSERPTSAARAVRRPALQRARGVFVVSPTSCSDRQFGSTPIHILLQSARSYCSRLNALPVARLLAQILLRPHRHHCTLDHYRRHRWRV